MSRNTITDHAVAVRTWLVGAAQDEMEARREWANRGVALLTCGPLFQAIRMPGLLVQAAVGTADPHEVDVRLAHALLGGPVIHDGIAHTYSALLPAPTYSALLPPGTGPRPSLRQGGAVFLAGSFIGVPDPGKTAPEDGVRYWSVPMNEGLDLCAAPAVAQLVEVGWYRLISGWRADR